MPKALTVCCAVLMCCVSTYAGISIDVGTHYLQPDTPDQEIKIYVTGDEEVSGLNFWVQISDGGQFGIDGPEFQSVDIVSGTIFSGNNTGQQNTLPGPQIMLQTVTTSSGGVIANGLLATLVIDTIGWIDDDPNVHQPRWELKLAGTLNGDTDFAGVGADITNGWIIIGADPGYDPPTPPEPASLTLLAISAGVLMRRRLA